MSEEHAKRIAKLRREYQAAAEAASVVVKRYETLGTSSALGDLQNVVNNAEKTYYVRLCAEVERMLYTHLMDYFHSLFDESQREELEKAAAFALIEHVRSKLKPNSNATLPTNKIELVKAVYSYRNRLAHGDRTRQAVVSITEAIERLEWLVVALPPMKPH